MGLFCVDLDHTIIKGHSSNKIVEAINEAKAEIDDEAKWAAIKDLEPVGSAERWCQIFAQLFADGHHVAIVTFNPYKAVIKRYLAEKLKLDSSIVDKIMIITRETDKSPIPANKNDFIAKANHETGKSYRSNQVVLVDDDAKNIGAAIREGYEAIIASDEGNHLDAISIKSKVLNQHNTNPPAAATTTSAMFRAATPPASPPTPDDSAELLSPSSPFIPGASG